MGRFFAFFKALVYMMNWFVHRLLHGLNWKKPARQGDVILHSHVTQYTCRKNYNQVKMINDAKLYGSFLYFFAEIWQKL